MNLPFAEQDELAIIGCCLLGGLETALEAIETVHVDAFTRPDVRDVFGCIEDLATKGDEINAFTVAKRWREVHKTPIPMNVLNTEIATAANLKYHVDGVLDASRRRKVITACHGVWTKAQDTNTKTDALIAEAEAALSAEEMRTVSVLDAKSAALIMVDDLERRYQLNGALSGISTGFREFDRLTDGLQRGEQTVIGARPSMGKTALGLGICAHAALRNRVPTLFVSLEMGISAIMRRLLALWKEVPLGKIRAGSYDQGTFDKFAKFNAFISVAPLWFLDGVGGVSITNLCATVRRRCRKDGVKLVVVDYLQKIRPSERHEKRTYEVAEVSNALKAVAVSTNCALVTLAQLNREPEKGDKRLPRLCDLADSGQIERDADCVGLIHRERDKASDEAKLFIAKQRDGETGMVDLLFNGEFCRFENRPL